MIFQNVIVGFSSSKKTRFQGRRIIKTKQWKARRHRQCIEPRNLFANSIINLYTKHLHKNSYQVSILYTSVALCAVGTSVTLHYLCPLHDSVCRLYKTLVYHSILRKNIKSSKISTQKSPN